MPKKPSPLTPLARKLRREASDAENRIWFHLRNRQLEGWKFRRQAPIDNYIVDFLCIEKGVVIELDGGQHAEDTINDKIRDENLRECGYEVLRFWNNEVFENIDGVLARIREVCLKR